MSDDSTPLEASFVMVVAGGVATLCVEGELDLAADDALSSALDRAMGTACSELVVDLHACPFLSGSAFALIEAAASELQVRRARIVVRGQPPSFDLIATAVGGYVFDAV